MRKDKTRPNTRLEISNNLSLVRKLPCITPSKVLNISNVTTRVAPDLLKALVTLLDTTSRRSAVDQEDLKPY